MNELKLVLTSGTQIVITEFSLPCHIVLPCDNKEDMQTVWAMLTNEELVNAAIMQDDNCVLKIQNATVEGTQTVSNNDGSLTAHFYLEGELYGGNDATLEAENADLKEALEVLGVTEETEVE